ncbi:hypothetical protein [Streptomyces sp. NPDC088923]|uniref:hypothetical protein n=1 Tax=Streptomyces sp. NPDC088923 TaxID=3365913 RepID=UPI0037F50769
MALVLAAGIIAGTVVMLLLGERPGEFLPVMIPVWIVTALNGRWQAGGVAEAMGTDLAGARRAQRAFRKKKVPEDAEGRRLLGAYLAYTRERRAKRGKFVVAWIILGLLCGGVLVLFLLDGEVPAALLTAAVGLLVALVLAMSWRRDGKRIAETERALADVEHRDARTDVEHRDARTGAGPDERS